MAVKAGTVTGSEITTNKDGTNPRLMLQVRMTSDADIQTVEYVPLPGQDERPINGTRVYILELSPAYKIAVGANDGVTPDTEPGEKRLYSLDDTATIKAFIKLFKTGIIEINGSGDFAVRFNALQNKLTALEGQLVAHVHPGVTAGAASTGASVTAFDADISAAKVDEVKLP